MPTDSARAALAVLARRWALEILEALGDEELGYNRVCERLDGISPRMLTHTLRALEREGLVVRSTARRGRVAYAVSPYGARALRAVHAIALPPR